MNESIQTQGKTVNDAVSEALLQLGLRRDEVEIKVIEEPKSGLLGFIGTRPARVLVRKKPEGRRGRRRDNQAHDNVTHSLSDGGGGDRRRSARSGKENEGRQSGRGGGRRGRGRGDQGRKAAGNEVRAASRGRSRGESPVESSQKPRNDGQGSARSEDRNAARTDNRNGGRSRRKRADSQPDNDQSVRAEREAVAPRGESRRPSRSRRGGRGRGRGRDRSAPTGRDEQMARSAPVASELPAAELAPETAGNQETINLEENSRMIQDKTDQTPTASPTTTETSQADSATPAATAPETPTPVAKPKRTGWGGGLGSRLKSKANPAVKAKTTKVVGETPSPSRAPSSPASPSPTRRETRGSGYDGNGYRDRRPAPVADEVIVSDMAASKYAKAVTGVNEENLDATLTELTGGILARAGFPCEVQVHAGEYRQVRIASDDESAGLLIGRHGQTVDAVEHLVERMASNAIDDRVRMNLDINDYRRRRADSLRERVVEAIAEVRETGKAYHVEPMSARERRLVHLEVEPVDGVRTYTVVGSGGKNVVIAPDDEPDADDHHEN